VPLGVMEYRHRNEMKIPISTQPYRSKMTCLLILLICVFVDIVSFDVFNFHICVSYRGIRVSYACSMQYGITFVALQTTIAFCHGRETHPLKSDGILFLGNRNFRSLELSLPLFTYASVASFQ